jgi:hypothetical protein
MYLVEFSYANEGVLVRGVRSWVGECVALRCAYTDMAFIGRDAVILFLSRSTSLHVDRASQNTTAPKQGSRPQPRVVRLSEICRWSGESPTHDSARKFPVNHQLNQKVLYRLPSLTVLTTSYADSFVAG